jgi:uncharacterized protein
MELVGEQKIAAPRERVWDALNDPAILARCIPGCESLTRSDDTSFEGKVTAKVGPVKASFTGAVTLSDIDPPNGYTITGEGKGGVAGFAKGGAEIRLADAPEGTLLNYTVKANVGGKLAQVGARLIDGVAKEYAESFFQTFRSIVESEPTAAAEVAPPSDSADSAPITTPRIDSEPTAAASPAAAAPPPATAPGATSSGLSPWVWALGLGALLLAFLWFLLV